MKLDERTLHVKTDPNETRLQRVGRKAHDLRNALLKFGVVQSPDADLELDELPPYRREKWIKLAVAYTELF
jgi:hypothetical protein